MTTGQRLFDYTAEPDEMVVGGWNIYVRLKETGELVTGSLVVVNSSAELDRTVQPMLQRLEHAWLAQSHTERQQNMAIAKDTARSLGVLF